LLKRVVASIPHIRHKMNPLGHSKGSKPVRFLDFVASISGRNLGLQAAPIEV